MNVLLITAFNNNFKDTFDIIYNANISFKFKSIDISRISFNFSYYEAQIKLKGFSSTRENEENLI